MTDKRVPFAHLHVHSEYSLLDGAIRLKDLVSYASEIGLPALAITDHGVMYGAAEFYQYATKAGIKPIIGCEVYVTPESRHSRAVRKDSHLFHLVLLARTNDGYRNLSKLVTRSFTEGYYYKPRVDLELLSEYADGLIALSACVSGEVPKRALVEGIDASEKALHTYLDIFGPENFYLELQDHGLPEQAAANKALVELARRNKVKLVATNDAHYLRKEDKDAHDALLCIQTNSVITEDDRFGFSSDQFYLKTYEEMHELFKEVSEALSSTLDIAERCDVTFEFGKIYLPDYAVPEGETLDSYLRKLCYEGARRRYGEVRDDVRKRLDYELSVIKDMGFSGYFLIVWDVISWARSQGIRVGPGRGSAAGSIVAYCLGISEVDPLRFNLLFERFLNPARRTMPDIDIDFAEDRRDEVIAYVRQKYGEERVAQIITFSTMKARAATRDAGRVLGHSYAYVDRIAKLITADTIEESLATVKELRELYENDPEARRILDTARRLEGLVRQDSIHAAGVVISRDPLTDLVPLQRKGDSEIVTQFSMKPISDIGLLKMDFLGLRTLTVIENALALIRARHGIDIDLSTLSLDDSATYRLLQAGNTIGVFQLEKPGMRAMLRELKPARFEDIIAANALNRPGPIKSGMVQDFINRKHGRARITYPHPDLEPVLKETYGTIVYQEQVTGIAAAIAGYSMAEADQLRAAVSKKKAEEFEAHRTRFIEGAVAHGLTKAAAEELFDAVARFAEYAFNKSHSTTYALVAYQTAWLKTHYPVEFMTALLTSVADDRDKIALYVNEARRMGITILHPDVNRSVIGFSPEGDASIRFGLATVRNVGEAAARAIIDARAERPFTSIYDFLLRVETTAINKRSLESLIKAGAFDSLGYTRKELLERYDLALERAQKRREARDAGQFSLFGEADGVQNHEEEFFRPSGAEEFPKEVLLSYEKEMLSAYVTEHPIAAVEHLLSSKRTHTTSELAELDDGTEVIVGGIISSVKKSLTKKGEPWATITLEDLEGQIPCIVWPSDLEKYKDLIVPDSIVLVRGRLDIRDEPREVKLIAQSVHRSDEKVSGLSRAPSKSVHITIDAHLVKDSVWKTTLKSLLARYPGRSPVYLHLVTPDSRAKVVMLGNEYRVKPVPGFILEARQLLRARNVAIKTESPDAKRSGATATAPVGTDS